MVSSATNCLGLTVTLRGLPDIFVTDYWQMFKLFLKNQAVMYLVCNSPKLNLYYSNTFIHNICQKHLSTNIEQLAKFLYIK